MKIKLLLIFLFTSNLLFGGSNIKFNSIVPNQNSKVSFNTLKDFAIDKNQNYYFLDNDLKKIFIFNKNGDFLKKLPNTLHDYMHDPVSVLVTSDNEIAVLDAGSDKVIFYDSSGNFVKYFGDDNGEIGSFSSPIDFAVDNQKNVYVLDSGNEKLLKFNQDGLFRGYLNSKSPIAMDVSKNGNIFILSNSGDFSVISVYSPMFKLLKTVPLNSMKNATDIAVSEFGDCYVVDSDLGGAFRVNISTGKIGNQFGVKSSTKGRQQFSEPIKINCETFNGYSNRIFIMDDVFNQVQSFDNSVDKNLIREKSKLPTFDIRIVDNLNNYKFKDILFDNDSLFYINLNGSIIKMVNNKIVYSLGKNNFVKNGITLSEPVALTKADGKIFVLDRDLNKVIVFNSNDGSYSFSFGESGSGKGKFDTPNDIVADNSGQIYIADTENSRLQIFSSDGLFIKQNILNGFYPSKIVFNSKNECYLLPKAGVSILKLNFKTNSSTTIDLKNYYPSEQFNFTTIGIVKNDLVMVYNSSNGLAYLLKDGKPFARFLSRGNGNTEIDNVTGFGFNKNSNQMFFYNSDSQQFRVLQLFFAPETPTDVRIVLNDNGKLNLSWHSGGKNTQRYIIFRKRDGADSLKYFALTKDTSLSIVNNKSEVLFDYVVQAVSAHDFKSNYSKPVADKYSYYQFLKSINPKDAIEKLNSIQDLNPKVINNEIYNIYKSLIALAKSKKNFDTALEYYDKMKIVKPGAYIIYLEKSSLLKHLQRFKEGIAELRKASELFPNNIRIWTKLINLQFVNKDYQGIIESCEKALKIFPHNQILLYNLAQSYVMLAQYPPAISIYRDLAISTGKERYFLKAGEVLIKVDSVNSAIDIYQQAENSGISNPAIYNAKSEALILKKNYKDAIFELEKSLSMDSTNAKTYFLLGKANANNRNIIGAIKAFRQSALLDSLNSETFFQLGQNLELIKRRKKAVAAYEKTITLDPNNIEAEYSLGKLYLSLKNVDAAVRQLSQAKKLFPDSKRIQSLYAKALTARKIFNKNRPPIEFSKIQFDEIFPSLLNYYNNHSIGSVTIFNTKNDVFEDVKIEIDSPKLLEHKTEINVPILLPNDYSENLISLTLKSDLINISINGEKKFPIKLTVTYNYKGKPVTLIKNVKILLHALNSIRWDDKRHLASFINPTDKVVRRFVTNDILSKFNAADNKFEDIPEAIVQAAEIWEFIREMNIAYVQDPNTSYAKISLTNAVDYVQFAQQTLKIRSGDCDDLVTLFSNLFESVGIETAYIDVPGHVFLAFNSGVAPDKLNSAGLSKNDVIIKFNKVWIPLETTVIGNNSFIESWSYARQRYKNELKQEHHVELVEIEKAAQTFLPIIYPKSDSLNISVNVDSVKKMFVKDLEVLQQEKDNFTEMNFLEVLSKYPNNLYSLNGLGLFYYKTKNLEKSRKVFNRVLSIDSTNIFALNNLGNLYFMQNNLSNAENFYVKAYKYDKTNPGLLLNIIRVELNQNKLDKAKLYYQELLKLNPGFASKYDDLKIRLAQKVSNPNKIDRSKK